MPVTFAQLEAAARAHDREESAYRGEPDPWDLPDIDETEAARFRSDRLSCMAKAFEAVGLLVEPSGFDRAIVALRIPPARVKAIDLALRTIRSKGVVDPDAFRQLLEDLPVFLPAASEALGVAQVEVRRMIGSGQVRAEPFLTRVEAALRSEFSA